MRTYEPMTGETIAVTAEKMVSFAGGTGDAVVANFNDVELTVNPDDDPQAIVDYYNDELGRRAEAYRNSPEGKRAAAEAEERKQQLQRQMDEAMNELDSLDFSDLNAVIAWLGKACDPSDHIGGVVPHEQIVDTFRENGYVPNANCGTDFNGEDEENFARWLIGQALEGLKTEIHAIRQIFHKFADDWRKKFGYA